MLPQTVERVWRPAVDPTGRYVVYIGQTDGQYDLFEFDFSTKVTKRLTHTAYDEWDPPYSPDGGSIVYSSRADGNWDLMRLARTSDVPERLTRTRR
ncbi:MAG: PD40 domain-containing protein [Gemmatimonadetes bacterium]|nr:PD40 domain-containing protein [Gemmatimonadota bacterium]